jgi:protein-tyrosine phosphatase
MTEIVPKLFVGTREDAAALGPAVPLDWCCICVTEYRAKYGRSEELPNEPEGAIELPFMQTGKADPAMLDQIAALIDQQLGLGKSVLVHCVQAQERSPLAIAWYLAWTGSATLETAYASVAKKHPLTEDRIKWVKSARPRGRTIET